MKSVGVAELRAALDAPDSSACLIDVREPVEFQEGHVPGARLVPLSSVPAALPHLPPHEPVYVICEVGARSAHAAAFLTARGVDAYNVEGGTHAWRVAGYPVER